MKEKYESIVTSAAACGLDITVLAPVDFPLLFGL